MVRAPPTAPHQAAPTLRSRHRTQVLYAQNIQMYRMPLIATAARLRRRLSPPTVASLAPPAFGLPSLPHSPCLLQFNNVMCRHLIISMIWLIMLERAYV